MGGHGSHQGMSRLGGNTQMTGVQGAEGRRTAVGLKRSLMYTLGYVKTTLLPSSYAEGQYDVS